jgi:hypothetical protein
MNDQTQNEDKTNTHTTHHRIWRNKWLTAGAASIDDMIDAHQAAADELRELKALGVTLDAASDVVGDYAVLVTTDKTVADSLGFDDEDDEDEEEETGMGDEA